MQLWRISNHAELTGLGGARQSGRWHTASPGKRIVYLAEHPAVALVESLANLRGDPTLFPENFQLLKIMVADGIAISELTISQIDSVDRDNKQFCQEIGDVWLSEGKSVLLRVPSVPSPESWNYLLNPLHPDASQIRIEWARTVTYDRRLFHLSK